MKRVLLSPVLPAVFLILIAAPLFGQAEPQGTPEQTLSVQYALAAGETGAVPPAGESIPVAGLSMPHDLKTKAHSKVPGRLAIAGLLMMPLDEELMHSIPRTEAGRKSDTVTEAVNTLGDGPILLATIGGLYALGSRYDRDTAKLALAALLNAGVATEVIKLLTGRERPYVSCDADVFHGATDNSNDRKSFPSGHTSTVFAVATVLANRHPEQNWLYYGLASAVGLARVRKSQHFPSDVVFGAAIGMQAGDDAICGGPSFFSIRF